jgi:prepilin-type processing-associated H-X9-DG protein
MRTRITVLLLVLIFLTCMGLLIPAIVQLRDAQQKLQCMNNLRQIGLAVQNFQSAHRRFPQAAVPDPGLPPEKRLSWLVLILPYLESSPLYTQIDWKKGWEADENHSVAVLPHWCYQCSVRCPERDPVSGLAPTTCMGITGVGADAAALPKGDARAGVFGYERELTPKDIEGRAGTLLMVAETARVEGTWIAAGPATLRGLDRKDLPYLGAGRQFGGLHRGGANGLFADGSVRFLQEAMVPGVFEALAKIAGGEGAERFDDR